MNEKLHIMDMVQTLMPLSYYLSPCLLMVMVNIKTTLEASMSLQLAR